MLSDEYKYKSNNLRDRYIEQAISYEIYISSLEEIQQEELNTVYNYEAKSKKQEIYRFEIGQMDFVKREIRIRQQEQVEAERKQLEYEINQKEIQEEEERIKSLTPEQKLYEERERYLQSQVPKLIQEYKSESKKYRDIHNWLQWAIIIGSAFVTSITGATIFTDMPTLSFTLKLIAACCSLVVTIVAGFTGYFKYRERSTNLQKAADDIEHEYEAIKLGTHTYLDKPREEAMGIFVDKILKRIREQREQQQILEQPPDTKHMEAGV